MPTRFGIALLSSALVVASGCAPLPPPSAASRADRDVGRVLPASAELLPADTRAVLWLRRAKSSLEQLGASELLRAEPSVRIELAFASQRALGIDLTDPASVRDAGVDPDGEVAVGALQGGGFAVIAKVLDQEKFERAAVAMHARSDNFGPPTQLGGVHVFRGRGVRVFRREGLAVLLIGVVANDVVEALSERGVSGRLADSPRFGAAMRGARRAQASSSSEGAASPSAFDVGFYVHGGGIAEFFGIEAADVVFDVEAAAKRLEEQHARALDEARRRGATARQLLQLDDAHRNRLASLMQSDSAPAATRLANSIDALAGFGEVMPSSSQHGRARGAFRVRGAAVASEGSALRLDGKQFMALLHEAELDPARLFGERLVLAETGVRLGPVDPGELAWVHRSFGGADESSRSKPVTGAMTPTRTPAPRADSPVGAELRAVQDAIEAALREDTERRRRRQHELRVGHGTLTLDLARSSDGAAFDLRLSPARSGLARALFDFARGHRFIILDEDPIERAAARRIEELERRRRDVLDRLYADPEPSPAP